MWEAAALSWVGVALGSFIDMKQAGKVNAKKLRWFEPKDELAQKYYQTELLAGSDNDKLIRIAEQKSDLDIVANHWTAQLQAELPKEEVTDGSESKE